MSANAEMVARAAEMVRAKIGGEISTALILGSGLGGLADRIEDAVSIPYRAIPGFPPSSVPGHAGRFVAGTLGARRVIVAAGRYHLYEGHSLETVALPTRVLHACGVRTLFVSNAAGGINRTMRPGDLMIIEDHLNLMSRTPLVGPERAGETRFPDMSAPYDAALNRALREAALESGLAITSGVYAALLGPAYETPAEIRMLEKLRRRCGGDVDGAGGARGACARDEGRRRQLHHERRRRVEQHPAQSRRGARDDRSRGGKLRAARHCVRSADYRLFDFARACSCWHSSPSLHAIFPDLLDAGNRAVEVVLRLRRSMS